MSIGRACACCRTAGESQGKSQDHIRHLNHSGDHRAAEFYQTKSHHIVHTNALGHTSHISPNRHHPIQTLDFTDERAPIPQPVVDGRMGRHTRRLVLFPRFHPSSLHDLPRRGQEARQEVHRSQFDNAHRRFHP